MKSLAILLLAALVAACVSERPITQRQSFLIQVERPGGAASPVGDSLRVGRVAVASPFGDRALVYRRSDVRYESDFYNQFAADPADMLAEVIAGWLRQGGLFRQVVPPGAAATGSYRLETSVSALYVDFEPGQPAAVMNLRWQVVREKDGEIVLELDCRQRVGLSEQSPSGAVRAYREALLEALGRLETALANSRF